MRLFKRANFVPVNREVEAVQASMPVPIGITAFRPAEPTIGVGPLELAELGGCQMIAVYLSVPDGNGLVGVLHPDQSAVLRGKLQELEQLATPAGRS